MPDPFQNTCAVILAGGYGRRLGAGEKPLATLAGEPLIAHVTKRLSPQTQNLAISVRAQTAWTSQFAVDVIFDDVAEAGPLAGVAAAMAWAAQKNACTVLTCPADCPFIPSDFAARLERELTETTDIVIATSAGRRHNLAALWRVSVLSKLNAALGQPGAGPVHRFQDQCNVKTVDWPSAAYDPFFNVNTAEDLTAATHVWSTIHEKSSAS